MKSQSAISVVFILACLVLLNSCNGSTNNNSNSSANANSASNNSNDASPPQNDNVEDLRSMVKISFDPEEVVWRTLDTKEKGKRLLTVVLLSPADHKALESRLNAFGDARTVSVNVEQWFPTELIAMGDASGESVVSGKAYPATEFFLPPFVVGEAILIPETDYLVLDVTEK